tara:strand:+ start:1438 stop:3306 length:1869 start_codon:yes stop_codon:yes gene_type:complete
VTFVKLKFKPGVDKEGTDYENATSWFETQLVRFRMGLPEKFGGWLKRTSTAFVGTCRAILPWTSLGGVEYVALGTDAKLYVESGGIPIDITPIRSIDSLAANPFNITEGSAEVIVTDSGHSAVEGDFVTFSGATSSDGTLTAAVMNAEYRIHTITSSSIYVVTMSAVAAGSDSTEGGSNVTATYQINVGLDSAVIGTGWGVSTWSSDAWGEAASIATDITAQIRMWSLATFGEDLIGNIYNGPIYQWNTSSGTGTRAVDLTSLSGATDVPTICRRIVVSAESRHLLALGCDALGASGTQDTLLIRWPDAETLTDWNPTTENTAGSLRLSTGSEIVTGLATKRDVLVWTDVSLNSVSYTGPPFFFGTKLLATNTSILGPNAAIQADDIVYWIGQDNFYLYDGSVKVLPCTLRDHVFSNLNRSQVLKCHVGINRADSEVTWWYPTTTDEIDQYVVFNYGQNIWYHGELSRTAWHDRTFTEYPIAAYTDGHIYHHEIGCDDGSTTPASAINAYAETSTFEPIAGDGFQYSFMSRLLPDVTFSGSDAASPAVTISLTPRDFPGASFGTANNSEITRSASTPVETFTSQSFIRVRGRSFQYKIASSTVGVNWRDGSPRVDVRPDGRQ